MKVVETITISNPYKDETITIESRNPMIKECIECRAVLEFYEKETDHCISCYYDIYDIDGKKR